MVADRLVRRARRVVRAVLPDKVVHALRRSRRLRRAKKTIDRPEDLYAFWRQPEPPGNRPHTYIPHVGRSQALLELISDLPPETRILEVGCNVGRNLAYLHDHGYHRVEGIEISPHAVALLRSTYPQLADVKIHLGPAEEILPGLPADGFDLIFTMAVIEHIHPEKAMIFDHMVRIGRSILAIEPPGTSSHRQFPHDVPKIFQSRGLRLVSSRPMAQFSSTTGDIAVAKYTAWRFERPDAAAKDLPATT